MIEAGKLQPQQLIGQTISLAEAATALPAMNEFGGLGVTVINQF
jgi:alcohol dehydrogenase